MDRLPRHFYRSAILLAAAPLALLAGPIAELFAAAPVSEVSVVDYAKQVKPLLTARCYACHGALKQEGGLRLDTAAALRAGGDSGSAVDVAHADASLLLERVRAKNIDERMPPEGEGSALKPDEIALLRTWIAAGAIGPADEQPEADPRDHWAFRAPQRPAVPQVKNEAWVRTPVDAFILAELEARDLAPQPPADPAVLLRRVYLDLVGLPPTREEIDDFIREHKAATGGRGPAPTRDQRSRVDDPYEAVVEKLLASPQYGERWGRHWMDIWRYSDAWGLGDNVRNSQKHMWHWRDWIVESLNDDLGYDEMIRQMLAADELYPDDLNKLRATGYLARSYFKFNRNTWLDQVVEHGSKGFLGITLNCSRCHDHKYDPFAQQDYYRFRAFFEPYQVRTDQLPGQADLEKDGLPRAFDCDLDAPTYRYVRGDETKPIKHELIAPGLPKLLGVADVDIQPVSLPTTAHRTGLRPWVAENLLAEATKKAADARAATTKARAELEAADKAKAAEAAAALRSAEAEEAAAELEVASLEARAEADRAANAESTDVATSKARAAAAAERRLAVAKQSAAVVAAELNLLRVVDQTKLADAEKALAAARDSLKKAEAAAKSTDANYTPLAGSLKAPASSTETEDERLAPYPTTSTGRRTALAAMLVDPANPLTARVAANHIWLRHMGKPLVPTVFDFGRKGTPPTHPLLLDWLAVSLRDGATREGEAPAEPGLAPLAPERGEGPGVRGGSAGASPSRSPAWSMKHLHRQIVLSNAYRMSSASAGNPSAAARDADNVYYWRMNPIRLEAQIVRDALLHLAGELDLTLGGASIDPAKDEFSRRRSLYFVHSHNDHHRFLAMFDDADVLDCYRREQSIVPQQALALANAKQSLEAAGKIAAKLTTLPDAKTDDQFIRVAFHTITAVEPSPEEVAACREALAAWRKLPPAAKNEDAEARARRNLVHALLNHNDFITVK